MAQLGEVVAGSHAGKVHRNFNYESHLFIDVTPDEVDADTGKWCWLAIN